MPSGISHDKSAHDGDDPELLAPRGQARLVPGSGGGPSKIVQNDLLEGLDTSQQRVVFEALQVPALFFNVRGEIIEANKVARAFLKSQGFPQSVSFFDLVPTMKQWRQDGCISLLGPVEERSTYQREGRPVLVSWNISPLRLDQQITSYFVLGSVSTRPASISRQAMLDDMHIGVAMIDYTHRELPISWANQAFCSQVGIQLSVLTGQRFRVLEEVFPGRDAIQAVREAVLQKEHQRVLVSRDLGDGAKSWHEMTLTPMVNDQGQVSHFMVLLQDVSSLVETEEKHQQNEDYLAKIVDSVLEAIITISPSGEITMFSQAASNIFGYSREDIIGRNVSVLMPKEHRDRHDGYIEAYRNTGTHRVIGKVRELVARRANGELFPIELAVNEVRRGSEIHFVGVVRDITDRQRVDRMKNEFVSIVSHELRTPLTSIQGALGIVDSGALGELSEQASKMVKIAYGNSMRLMRLINDILDVEKIEAGGMEFNMVEIDPASLVKDVLEANASYARKYQVEFRDEAEGTYLPAFGDPDRLSQVLTNLVSNAINHSPQGGGVTVAVDCQREGYVRVTVADKGPGVPENFRDRLFDRFTQADASDSRKRGGSGLGLSIAQAIVDRHGGRIGVDSKEGQGATFWFEIPSSARHLRSKVTIEGAADEPCVITFSANPLFSEQVKSAFAGEGILARQAPSGSSVLSLLERDSCLGFVLELSPETLNRLLLLKELKRGRSFETLPVVIGALERGKKSSSIAKVGSPVLGRSVTVLDWVPKPVDRGRVVRPIRWLRARKTQPIRVLCLGLDTELCGLMLKQISSSCEIVLAHEFLQAREIIEDSLSRFDLVYLGGEFLAEQGAEMMGVIARMHGIWPPIVMVSDSVGQVDIGMAFWERLLKARHMEADLMPVFRRWATEIARDASNSRSDEGGKAEQLVT